MARYSCRCSNSKCRARRTFPRHPEHYIRPPKCFYCSGRVFIVDPWMMKRDTRAMGCMCAGYAWGGVMSGAMHRRGSLHCWYTNDGRDKAFL